MPADPAPKLSPAKLRKAYLQDLAAAWSRARRAHAQETPYAFVLYGVEGGEPPQLWPCVLTEESLTRVAQRYVEKGHHDTLEEARDALRYSVADSPHVNEMQHGVPTVDALTAPHAKTLDDDTGYTLLAKAAIAALKELDAQGLFGAGAARERLLLLIITEDTPKDWSTESARRLNPPAVFARFEADTRTEGVCAASDTIVISPDSHSLYSAGTRDNANADEESDDDSPSEIVAYDLAAPRLTRRWTYQFPGFGDSVRALAMVSDGRSFIALRARYNSSKCDAILMRFSADSDRPIHQHQFAGEPAGLAQTRDGTRIAVALHNKTLHLFDADFKLLATRNFDHKIYHPIFLGTGELLIPTDRALLRINPSDEKPATIAASLRSFDLATDAAEATIAVGRWFEIARSTRDVQFGVHLLRLPTFEHLRTILIPSHQAVSPTLSPNGRLLALVAHEIGKPREFIAIFDTATGQEIARRKSDTVNQLAFLPDNQTLAIATSDITTTEPIEFWYISPP